jgi:hypothetical protein
MAKIGRSREIWHIPKRGNVHQTIYMVYVLTWDKFLKKTWSSGKQEALGSEMGKYSVVTDESLEITKGTVIHNRSNGLYRLISLVMDKVAIETKTKPKENHTVGNYKRHKKGNAKANRET